MMDRKNLVIKRYLSGIYKSLLLLLIMLPFQNCIEMEGFDAASSGENSSVVEETPTEDEDSEIEEPETPDPQPPADPSLKAAFVAVGHQGSSMYTCDGGRSWKGYRQLVDIRCNDPNLDGNCDHQDYSGKNVRWTPSEFVLHYGHGGAGPTQRSTNGHTWETLIEETRSGGLAYGNGTLILMTGSYPLYSDDDGDSWTPIAERHRFGGNIRAAKFVPHGGANGVFIVQANGGGNSGISVSYDNGRSYQAADVRPETCSTGALAYSDSRILISSYDLCYFDDAGRTWTVIEDGIPRAPLIHDGNEFKLYDNRSVFSSIDGITWTETTMTFNGGSVPRSTLGNITYHKDSGQYVSVGRSNNRRWYEETVYSYSSDGINWTSISDSSLKPAAVHPVRQIAAGYLNCD